MPTKLKRPRARRAGKVALSLLLAGSFCAVLPAAAHALGGPWPIAVSVEGEVRNPGSYTLPHDATLSALLSAAGGLTDRADPRGAALLRVSARAAQEAELQKLAAQLAADPPESDAAAGMMRAAAARILGLRPSGRIPVRVTHPRLLKNSPDDLRLEKGDVLRIPAGSGTVAVAGAVLAPSDNVSFAPGQPLAEYVRRAGGYAENAERGHVFLIRTDGTTDILTPGFISWNPSASRWEVTSLAGGPPAIGPGDTIVVPRSPGLEISSSTARKLQEALMRASGIAGMPVVLPAHPPQAPP